MTPYNDALEAFNRAPFDPPTPEIIPAEELQADEHPMADAFPIRWAVPLAFGLGLILTIVGAWA